MVDYNGLTIGFHGCKKDIAKDVLLNRATLTPSSNEYDWLGGGLYFWENDPIRALEFATDKYVEPFVIGAVLNLGYCLDLATRRGLEHIQLAWDSIVKPIYDAGKIRSNKPGRRGETGELMLRYLDCYVIESLHKFNLNNEFEQFDSVRAPFWEGDPIYHTAGFCKKNHIQLCIRNPECVIGYFLPRELGLSL